MTPLLLLLALILGPGETRPSLPPTTGADGRQVDWALPPTGKALVVVVYSSECPISNEYSPTVRALAERTTGQARFVGVCVDDEMADSAILEHAREHGLPFPVARDVDGRVASALGAKTSPEAVVIDSAGVIRYRGRIDDQFAARGKRNAHPSEPDLARAIAAVAAGRPVAAPWPPAVGCPLPERRAPAK